MNFNLYNFGILIFVLLLDNFYVKSTSLTRDARQSATSNGEDTKKLLNLDDESAAISENGRYQAIESKAENKAAMLHQIDTLNLMLYTFLLILTVCTVWLFKHRRFKFVHETGLTLIYGLIVGLIIWLTSRDSPREYLKVVPENESETMLEAAPDFLSLHLPAATTVYNKSSYFRYKFDGEEVTTKDGQQFDSLMEMKATFDPEVFFDIFLPPIMFQAGFSLKRRHFFRNIGSILMFAILGTTISCVVVGLVLFGVTTLAGLSSFTLSQAMLFGALISATDPVTVLAIFNDLQVENDLFAIVFGESALNDAVAIVLCRTIEEYSPSVGAPRIDILALLVSVGNFLASFLGSISLGVLCGFVAALFTKFTKIREFPLLETSLFVLISYMSFLTAEACGMTGVVAALFCGISQAHYTFNNLSDESKVRTKQFFELLNFLSENFIFTYIGVSMFTSKAHIFNVYFILGAFGAVIIGRAAHIYPFSIALNFGRRPKIPCNHMHMMMFAGLRGAVAFALASRNTSTPERRLIYTATALIVIFTVVVNGGLTIPMIEWLKIKHGSKVEPESQVSTESHARIPIRGSLSNIPNHNPWDKAFIPRQWYNFDRKFLKPLLTDSRPTLMETMPSCCYPLAKLLTTTEQMNYPLIIHPTTETECNLADEMEQEEVADDNEILTDVDVQITTGDGSEKRQSSDNIQKFV